MPFASPSYLLVHRNKLYFRIRIPDDLRRCLGKTAFKLSLRTSYLRDARPKCMRLALTAWTIFEFARRIAGDGMDALTEAKIQELAGKWLREALADGEERRAFAHKPMTPDELDGQLEALSSLYTDAREDLALNDYRGIQSTADDVLKAEGITVNRDALEYRSLCRELLKARVKGLEIEERRSVGDYPGEVSAQPVPPTAPPAVAPAKPKGTLARAIEKYIRDKEPHWRASSRQDIPPQLWFFADILGRERPIDELDRDALRKYLDTMTRLPAHRRQPRHRGKSIKQLLALDVPEGERYSAKTLETRFTNVRSFIGWAEVEGLIDRASPLNKILTVPGGKVARKSTKRAYTDEELARLFHSPDYAKDRHSKPWQFWMPILGLFTGARIEELAQLHLADIRQEGGVWVFDLNDLDEKEIKTAAGRRLVPIHPFLIKDLRLVEYVEDLRGRGFKRLFPTLKHDAKGKYSHAVSKWFTRYRRACDVGAKEGASELDFHSFRRTMITFCKHNGIDRHKVKELVGHEAGEFDDVTSIYEERFPPAILLRDVVERLNFHKTLKLEHLGRSRFVLR